MRRPALASPQGGQGALAQIGALDELRMRESITQNGHQFDQVRWSIPADEWRQARRARPNQRTAAAAGNPDTGRALR